MDLEKKEVKKVDVNAEKFEANGKTYYLETALSIERFTEYQFYEKELGYNATFKGIFDKIMKANKAMNKLEFTTTAVILNDLLKGIAKLEERQPTVLKICALFLNTENENRLIINKDMIAKKIEDWKEEGIDISYFFTLAGNMVSGFLTIYKNITQSISLPISALNQEIEPEEEN